MHVASQYIWLHCVGHSQKPIHRHENCGFFEKLQTFFYTLHRLGGHFGSHFGGHLGFTCHLHVESHFLCCHWVGHNQKPIHIHKIVTLGGFLDKLGPFSTYFIDSVDILEAILAAILDLQVTCT